MKREIFVGREYELQQFQEILEKHRKKSTDCGEYARTLLISGLGGMGKSYLCAELRRMAHEQLPEMLQLFVDWENVKKQGSTLRVDELLDAIAREIPNEHQKHLKPYYNVKKDQQKVQEEVDRILEQNKQIIRTLSDTTSNVISGASGSVTLKAGVSAGLLILGRILTRKQEKFLRERHGLNDEKILLYQEPEQIMAVRLRECLEKIARKQKNGLLLVFDTCELIKNCEEWLADHFLIPLMNNCEAMILIFTGRDDPYYQRSVVIDGEPREVRGFTEKLHSHKPLQMGMPKFGISEIQHFLEINLTEAISDELIQFVEKLSCGVPYAVDLLTNAIQFLGSTAVLEKFKASDLQATQKEIIEQLTKRFLIYCFNDPASKTDLQYIYSLAILDDINPKLLRQIWDIKNPNLTLQTLKSKYVLLTRENRLHNLVQEFIVSYLDQDELVRDEMLNQILEKACRFYKENYEEQCTKEDNWESRFAEPRWRDCVLKLMNGLTWYNPDEAAHFFIDRSLELLLFDFKLIEKLHQLLHRVLNQPLAIRKELKSQVKRIYFLAKKSNLIRSTAKDRRSLIYILLANNDRILKKWKFSPVYEAILYLMKGNLYYLLGDLKAAWEALYYKCDETLFDSSLKKKLAAALHILGKRLCLDDNNSFFYDEMALKAFKKAVKLESSSCIYWYHLGVMIGLKGDYQRAVEAFQKSIDLAPRYALSYVGLGNVLANMNNHKEAISAYQKAIKLDPKSGGPHFGLGNIYQRLALYRDAVKEYRISIEHNPNHAAAYYGLGKAYSELNQYEDAILVYQKAVDLMPNKSVPLDGLAKAFLHLNQHSKALDAYQKAINIAPQDALLHNNLGYLYLEIKLHDDAVGAFKRAIYLKSGYASAYNGLAKVYLATNQTEKAVETLENAILIESRDAALFKNLGKIYFDQAQYKKAAAAFERALEISPGDAQLYNRLGQIYLDLNCYDQSILAFRKAIELDPKYSILHKVIANILMDLGRYKQAIGSFKRAIEINRLDASLYNELGKIYTRFKRYRDAIKIYQQGIKHIPRNAAFYNGLGNIYFLLHQDDNAIKAYKQAIHLDPTDAASYNGFGNICYNLNLHEQAVVAYQKSIQLRPADAAPYNGLGNVYLDLNRLEQAKTAYLQAIKLNPHDSSPYNGIGIVYRRLSEYKNAMRAYKKAIKLSPLNASPNNGLGYLYLMLRKLKHATSHFNKAIELDPQDYVPYINMGMLYFRDRQKQMAADYFKKGLARCTQSTPVSLLNKITAYLGLGEAAKARDVLNNIAGNFPLHEGIKEQSFTDWKLLRTAPEPPTGIDAFIREAEGVLNG